MSTLTIKIPAYFIFKFLRKVKKGGNCVTVRIKKVLFIALLSHFEDTYHHKKKIIIKNNIQMFYFITSTNF